MIAEPASLANAPRCGARTRSGAPCRSPAVGGVGRCRMHGGRGSGAPRGNRNAWKHGVRSAWYRDTARYIRAANPAAVRRLLAGVGLARPLSPRKNEKRTDNPMQREMPPFIPPRHGEGDRRQDGGRGRPLAPTPVIAPTGSGKGHPISLGSSLSTHGTARPTAQAVDRARNEPYPDAMIDRRQTLALLGATLAFGGPAVADAALAATRRAAGPGEPFSWEWLKARAASLARGEARPLPQPNPRAHAIDYDAANRIAFRSDRALFAPHGVDDGYAVRLFPIVRNAPIPVRLSVVEQGRARRIEHSEDMFAVTPGEGGAPHIVPGIAGFRVMNRGGVGDWLAFLGASYFRSAGPLDQYGLSARGLAIDTGIAGAEEFPVFTAFWLERTGDGLTVYALLEGPSVTGAFRIASTRGAEVVQDVSMAIWLRRDVRRLGIAPLTSMFWYDEGNPRARADWRPEIHDSDGLLIHNRAGERIWRPLGNPPRASINGFSDPAKGPWGAGSGFGLLQRDRAFDHYQDDGVFYEKRPSLWVEPRGDWGPGAVMLYEIPTARETDDNIVAFWTPDRPAKAGTRFAFDYRLRWLGGEPDAAPLARVVDRWTGTAGRPGLDPIPDARRLVVDFEGPSLQGLDRGSGVRAVVSVDRGRLLSAEAYPVVGRPARWRLIADSMITPEPANLRATLEKGDTPLTETLIHQFS